MATISSNGKPYINCKNVVRAYAVADHEIVALRGIDFTMQRGEMVAIVGPSGAGKSSLLNLLGGLDKPTAGQLSVGDLNLLELKGASLADYRLRKVGFVWQQVSRNLLAHRSALRNVTLPMMMAGVGMRQRKRRAKELLDAVGIAGHMHKRPSQLSGGQQQRVAIAVALANQPQLLLADEPTGALDRKSAEQVMELIANLRERYGLTILMVTHDMEMASYADRTLTLRDGALGQDMTHEEAPPELDEEGRIQIPTAARVYLNEAAHIAVEIRPEGVLLRPEQEVEDNTDLILQDMLPHKNHNGHSKFRLLRRNGKEKPS
ncbi:MAG TPA: ABC transporter ATP-binding protein [Aggregatilineaceae bacterium]|nr:ABC transporter ATP-binding protein [Aggregatilineaceae bacterium]